MWSKQEHWDQYRWEDITSRFWKCSASCARDAAKLRWFVLKICQRLNSDICMQILGMHNISIILVLAGNSVKMFLWISLDKKSVADISDQYISHIYQPGISHILCQILTKIINLFWSYGWNVSCFFTSFCHDLRTRLFLEKMLRTIRYKHGWHRVSQHLHFRQLGKIQYCASLVCLHAGFHKHEHVSKGLLADMTSWVTIKMHQIALH